MITTFNELKSSIESYLDRDDIDVEELIQLAEARHERDIRFRGMLTTATATVSRTLQLPLSGDGDASPDHEPDR